MATPPETPRVSRYPVLDLLHPREQVRPAFYVFALGLVLWGALAWAVGMPVYGGAILVLGMLLIPGARKWQADLRRHGLTVMVLCVLLYMQGFHSVEHIVQWVQFHLLLWAPSRSSGLISAANAEFVHFTWNWAVVAVTVFLAFRGVRNPWVWLLLGWSVAHALEHTYMTVRYLQLRTELHHLGAAGVSAQGLPGVLGRDGWLAKSPATHDSLLGMLPGISTATRLDVHFWWNTVETTLLFLGAHSYLRHRPPMRYHGPG